MTTVWIKQGVIGDLRPAMQKVHGKIAALYISKGKDLFVTSRRDGNHGWGSFHYIGLAEDVQKNGVKAKDVREAAGPNCDMVIHDSHFHVEYDPRQL